MNEHIFDENGSYYDGSSLGKYEDMTLEELEVELKKEKALLEKEKC